MNLKRLNDEPRRLVSSAYCDVETENLGGRFLAGACLINDEAFVTRCERAFFEYVINAPVERVYFHNLEYDARYLLDHLLTEGYQASLVHRANRLLSIAIDDIQIVDSYALFPSSLRALGDVFSYKGKLVIDFETTTFDPSRSDHIEYLVRDCEVLRDVVEQGSALIHQTFNVNPRLTAASTAVAAFRNTLREDESYRASTLVRDDARASYRGGLVWFRDVDVYTNIRAYDFNSMYPSVMRDFPFPINEPIRTNKLVDDLSLYLVDLDASRAQMNLALANPVWCWREELEALLRLGYRVNAIVRAWCWTESAYPFKPFVDKCERLRLAHNKDAVGQITKIIQNSLYGKFGSNPEQETLYLNQPEQGTLIRSDDGCVSSKQETIERAYHIVEFASRTTSLARARLLNAALHAGPHHVVYLDTDSLFVERSAEERLNEMTGTRYGALKDEGLHRWLMVLGKKLYFSESKARAKGFNKCLARQIEQAVREGRPLQIPMRMLPSTKAILTHNKAKYYDTTRAVRTLTTKQLVALRQKLLEVQP